MLHKNNQVKQNNSNDNHVTFEEAFASLAEVIDLEPKKNEIPLTPIDEIKRQLFPNSYKSVEKNKTEIVDKNKVEFNENNIEEKGYANISPDENFDENLLTIQKKAQQAATIPTVSPAPIDSNAIIYPNIETTKKIAETVEMIDKEFDYSPSGFSIGSLHYPSNKEQTIAKILAYAIFNKMSFEETLALFGEKYLYVKENQNEHDFSSLREFVRLGFEKVAFDNKNGVLIKK
jgi:hypothetical protein